MPVFVVDLGAVLAEAFEVEFAGGFCIFGKSFVEVFCGDDLVGVCIFGRFCGGC